ncbi:cytochrome B [Candidatus Kaiserbacteria bacterium]|nr:MAG: cytochrome B [Candidatus Kaiserbacteria bacterium]
MEEALRSAHRWLTIKADTTHARVWLVALSFTESCVFFIPPDPLLAAMVFVHEERWWRYALLTSIASIVGAIAGYALGAVLFDTIGTRLIEFYSLDVYMQQAAVLMQEGLFLFTLTAAFTPIPFKVAVLAAGFTKANFFVFLVAVILGRGLRYITIAYVAKIFGVHTEKILKRFWLWTSVVGGVGILLYLLYMFM